jgi:histidinol-phosphatase (PHP family)
LLGERLGAELSHITFSRLDRDINNMPYSHHSHSGQFCGHAKDTLEQVIQAAIAKGFHTFALTEHIPRPLEDFYPGEAESHTVESLAKLFDDFIVEANRLRDAYSSQMQILIGFETEWIRPSTLELIRRVREKYPFDFFMGSVHHVHTIPIDYDREMYEQARDKAGGTDERLFEDYFDAQLEMLQELRPPVVGHLDLIRLLSDHRDDEFKGMAGVWQKIERNLDFIASYGGLLELNSAGLRKGLAEPYPCLPICQVSHTAICPSSAPNWY